MPSSKMQWLKLSTALMVFGVGINYEEALTFFDFKGWYIGWFLSIVLLLGRFRLTKNMLFIATAVMFPTVFALLMGNYSDSNKGLFVFVLFTFMMIYARALVRALGQEAIVRIYAKVGVLFSVLIWINELLYVISPAISKSVFGYTEAVGMMTRGQGIFLEPSEAALYLTPALAYFFFKRDWHYSLLVFSAMLMTFSSLTYIAILLCFLLFSLNRKLNFLNFAALNLTIAIVAVAAVATPQIIERFSMLAGVTGNTSIDFQNYNASVASVIMNAVVAKDSLLGSNFIGIGFGNFLYGFNTYAASYFPPGYSGEGLFWNRETGGSLLIRVTAELGVIGIAVVFYLLYSLGKSYASVRQRNRTAHAITAEMRAYIVTAIVMFVISLLRKDSVTNVHLFIFVMGALMNRVDVSRYGKRGAGYRGLLGSAASK